MNGKPITAVEYITSTIQPSVIIYIVFCYLQLLISVEFNQPVKLHSLKLHGPEGGCIWCLSFLTKNCLHLIFVTILQHWILLPLIWETVKYSYPCTHWSCMVNNVGRKVWNNSCINITLEMTTDAWRKVGKHATSDSALHQTMQVCIARN